MDRPDPIALREVSLDDKYDADSGTVYMTGTQAMVRLPLMQRRRDLATGRNTAGYISGYRGSPVGGYDQALWKASRQLDAHHVRFVPGLNEDLAATAIWGTQQVGVFGDAKYDGVFAIWYGKGPGVDRSGDALRHANQAGTAALGGVLALAGDDHGAKSSTMAAQTDPVFAALSIPVLAPATVQDYLDLGLHGFAMSRFAGVWVGFKAVTDTIETAGIVDVSRDRVRTILPSDFVLPPGGLNLRWPEEPFVKMEERLARWKLPAALAYARANRLDRVVLGSRPAGGRQPRLGIVSTGKSWLDVMQALADLGIDEAQAQRIGLSVYRVAMPWPLEPEGIREFCAGLDEVLVIEEKRALVESQLKEQLYCSSHRPRVLGKRDDRGAPFVPEAGELSPAACARLIVARLHALAAAPGDPARGVVDRELLARADARLALLDAKARTASIPSGLPERIPYFCSGCPHNTSTRVPEGSRALAGIGCHYMAQWMDRSTATFTQMGGEGMTWVGQAPFCETAHVFQNLGDGTYNHSGSLAIRHAVATRTRITFKILFNDAVAMTGGQTHDGGQLTPQAIARQVRAEGVQRIVVVTDAPDKYPAGSFDADIPVRHRRELDEIQRELREHDGVSVLIYDQTCAAEKRRRRKRGSLHDPERRVFINEAVCEGCGDCGVQSNCVSILPVETEFGRKRAIDQSSCNKDYACVEGFCPSFVTVEGGRLRRGRAASIDPEAGQVALPEVVVPTIDGSYAMLVNGIGGTGVVTIGQILGMAAHLEGKGVTVLDMTGLAQKNGAVISFLRFADDPQRLHAPRIGVASADAIIGCDVVVTAGRESLARMAPGRTRVVANVAGTPTADFTRDADWRLPLADLEAAIVAEVGADRAWFIDATRLANALMGDAILANMLLLGYAWQKGMVPVSSQAIERAIVLNAVAVEQNHAAFLWGRRAAVETVAVEALAQPAQALPVSRRRSATLDEAIARRIDFLVDYQDEDWALRYRALVDAVRTAELRLADDDLPLTGAVARSFFRLMAYKDEYEVARLYTQAGFQERLAERFEGDFRLRFHLAPPLLARRNARGELVKREYGAWVMPAFRLLARMRRLRGSAFDPFGRTAERRTERALIDSYERTILGCLPRLDPGNRDLLVRIASIPEQVRGFGHVKARNLATAEATRTRLLGEFDASTVAVDA